MLVMESLLVVELLASGQVLLGLGLDQHALVAGDGLGTLSLFCVSMHIASKGWHPWQHDSTHLEVLLGGLLPFLGHGARADGAREHARASEDHEGSGNDTGGEEEDVAALIRRRGSSGTMGTEGDVVCCRRGCS